ncbi:MAG: nucleotide exchange factor GrpE [Anaplasma sp.]
MAEERSNDPEHKAGGGGPAGLGTRASEHGGPASPPERRQNPQKKFAAGIANKAQSRLTADVAELERLKAEVEHLRDQLRLAVADSKNLERIMQKTVGDTRLFAISDFARDLVSSLDNLEASLKNLNADDNVHAGIKMTWDGLIGTLGNHGVSRVSPVGKVFDPRFHKAVTQAVDETKPAGVVLEVIQAGYTIQDKVLRPALVVVSKRPD